MKRRYYKVWGTSSGSTEIVRRRIYPYSGCARLGERKYNVRDDRPGQTFGAVRHPVPDRLINDARTLVDP